jgi:hypothetical protein
MAKWGRHPDRVPFAEQALRYGEKHGEAALAAATDGEIRAFGTMVMS